MRDNIGTYRAAIACASAAICSEWLFTSASERVIASTEARIASSPKWSQAELDQLHHASRKLRSDPTHAFSRQHEVGA